MTKSNVIFIADYFSNNTSLLQNLGTNHQLGGAEQDDLAMLEHLEKKIGTVEKVECTNLMQIDPTKKYIVSNFALLPIAAKDIFIKIGNYVIYEHDHKYCKTRNPGLYKNFIIPKDIKDNLAFYSKAKAVFCMTRLHKSIMDRNIESNSIALNGSFWTSEELNYIENLIIPKKRKKFKWFIYGNNSYHKGLAAAITVANQRDLEYDIICNKNTRTEFLSTMSEYYGLIFQPQSPETCSRLVVEAKMLGLDIINNSMVGAAGEDWFTMNTGSLVQEFKKTLMPDAINKIIENLE